MNTIHLSDTPNDERIDELLRPPSEVMTLERLGAFHQTRLSFMRALLRRLKREQWAFERTVWEIDNNGEGHAVYVAKGPRHTYSLVAFANDLPDEQRSDRVIASAWDATFCLFDGIPTAEDIARLKSNVPYQEKGRLNDTELTLSRANRSVRLWQHVIDHLATGQQPDIEQIHAVGYLMRTTAVYGSGKFGSADRYLIEERELAGGAFRIEMLTVYLIRAFSLDLVETMAQLKGGDQAVTLEQNIRRQFGVGNSTGLGMAPFLINHPILLHNWIIARERAFARVRALPNVSPEKKDQFLHYLARAQLNAERWNTQHELQSERLEQLRNDLDQLSEHISNTSALDQNDAWQQLWLWAKTAMSNEGQEQLVGLIIEPYGELVDDLTATMGADEYSTFGIDGQQTIARLKQLISDNYHWAMDIDFTEKSNKSRFWYVSESKMEPRLGERFEEDGAENELPIRVGWDVHKLHLALQDWRPDGLLADFLLKHPEHRHIVRRIQLQAKYPYAEIQDNTISATFLPIDMLRCKLSFFGATHFDPRSDRWVRICMFPNAPFPHELADSEADDWAYPSLDASA